MKNDRVFCGIVEGEAPSFKVYEDEGVLACLDINPIAKGHTLVILKEHYKGILDTDDKVLAELIVKVKRIAAHVALSIGCDGFSIVQNNGDVTGQAIRHVHFHIIPRWNGDPLTFENKKGDMDELAALAEKIRM